jgi:hypothetical protein
MEPDRQGSKTLALVTFPRAGQLLRRFRRAAPARPPTPDVLAPRQWADELTAEGVTAAEWVGRRLARNALYVNVSDARIDRLRHAHPALAQATIDAARRVLRHEFDLLGSGPYTPDDPDRQADASGYRPIDWYMDPVSGLRFPRGVPLAEWSFETMRPPRSDIKLPWELARCQHWPALGQAYRLTGDDRFALEIASELLDFMEANPIGTAVNWACTMDVALRAANWAIGLELVRGCVALTHDFWREAYEALFDHGTFIETHLENTYGVTSNHFLSNVVGLFFLAAVFDDLPRGRLWEHRCREWLVEEMATQVLPDGADFESSVPYHRLMIELFLGSARLADYRGAPLPPGVRARLRNMVDYLAAVQRPDGLMPQVGDADDGRLHILSGYGTFQPQDGRHAFGPAACFLGNREWTSQGGEWMAWETAWWGFDCDAPSTEPAVLDGLRHFPQAGLTVMRRGGDYLLVTNGIVGTAGFGNHKHNDLLGFEYHVDGVPVLVDPGSYVYTPDPDARNLFRSTRSHNTLSVDGEEQNELRPDWLFRMFEQARPEHLEVDEQSDGMRYRGRHHGYARLPQPVVHERAFTWSRLDGVLTIADVLHGQGTHRIRWHFHFASGVDVSIGSHGGIEIQAGAAALAMTIPADVRPSLSTAWYSPSYGVRRACTCLDVEIEERIDGRREYMFDLRSARVRTGGTLARG